MKLWSLAGRVYHEAILQGQLLAAGSNAHRLTERMKKDAGYIRRQASIVQGVGSFYLLMVATLSVFAFVELRTGAASSWNVLVASLSVTVQLIIQSGYLMMLTILATAEILAPDLYRWPASLPLSRDEVGGLKVLALAREYLAPLAVIVLTMPLVAGLASGSLVNGLVGAVVGIAHAAMTLGVAVLAAWRMRRVLRDTDAGDRRATIARVVSMLIYGVGTLLVVFIMQIGSNVISSLFGSPRLTGDALVTLMRVLALAPLPTAPASLLALIAAGGSVSALSLWMPTMGTLGYVLLAGFVIRRAINVVRGAATPVRRISAAATHAAARTPAGTRAVPGATHAVASLPRKPLDVLAPRAAFRRQIGRAATRDTQALVSLLFPLVFPLLATVGPTISGGDEGVASILAITMGGVMSSWMVIQGMTRLQFGGGGLEATLPVRERDRVFPRLWLASILPTAGVLLPVIFLFSAGSPERSLGLIRTLAMLVVGPAGLMLKLGLFGRMRTGSNPVVLDEVRTGARFWKWAAVLALLLVLSVGVLVAPQVLRTALGPATGAAVFIAGAALLAAGEIAIARKIFP